jgi:hypothetical protein
MLRQSVFLCAALLLAIGAYAVDFVRPEVKPGLWQVTDTPKVTGELPIPEADLARMSSEQRAHLEDAMRERLRRGERQRVMRECMTSEKIARGFELGRPPEGEGCKRDIVKSTATELTVHEECTRPQGRSVTDLHFEIRRPTQMTGRVDMVTSAGARTMKVHSVLSGHWLSPDCGNVKDVEMVK